MYQHKPTDPQKIQQKLFQELGTLYRIKMNLQNLTHPSSSLSVTALQRNVLDAATNVVYDLIQDTRNRMKTIPKTPKK